MDSRSYLLLNTHKIPVERASDKSGENVVLSSAQSSNLNL